ncbi:MAG: 5'-methylthioadenosine/S-adenosylhomocysteine nucleosidase [Oscillospiraceae bacterium]|nr:5'-methylthioadenosine/S-adenosylhomocysteine nucleosidase [Oscillospiraceae bacterium]
MKRIFGFIFADDMEFKPFSEYAYKRGGKLISEKPQNIIELETDNAIIYGIESGVGKVNSALAALELIKSYSPNYIMSAGLSGAISGLVRGDIVAGNSFVECDFDVRAFGYPLGKKPDGAYIHEASKELLEAAKKLTGMKVGRLGTGDFFLTDSKKKNEYKEEFQISAFDMESAAIAATCSKYGIPFMSVRKISDDADDSATVSYREMNNLCEETLTEILIDITNNMD